MENYAGSQPASPPPGSQESNFPKKLSKTKSPPYGSAALLALRSGQASAFRGLSGPLRATLRCGCGFPVAAPGSPSLPSLPGLCLLHPASLGPAEVAPSPRLPPPLKPNGGNGIFSGRLVRDTSRGTWGARGCGSPRLPLLPLPHPTPGLPWAPAASGSSCEN